MKRFLLLFLATVVTAWSASAQLSVSQLRTEHLTDPVGIGERRPLLSWEVSDASRRGVTQSAVRLPAFVMIIAALTTCIELLMQAFTYELYQILGIFIPLITTNCVILGRADAFAAKHGVARAAFDGLMMGLGFALVLLALGGVRELLGSGTLFANMQLLFGPGAAHWQLQPFGSDYRGFLLAILPPGAFLVLGLLIAAKNLLDARAEERAKAVRPAAEPSVRQRVRVTGVVE